MRILVVGSSQFEIYAKAFLEAFRRIGHQVQLLDTDSLFRSGKGFWNSIVERARNRFLIGPSINAASLALEEVVADFKPDLVFLYHCYCFHPSAVKTISSRTVVFSYDNDDPFEKSSYKLNSKYYRTFARYCKMNYVYRKKNVEDFRHVGIENVKVLLPYYIETRNYPIACEKDIPLAFVGHWEDDGRDEMINALLDAGLPFSLYGEQSSWSRSRFWPVMKQCFHGPANGVEYNKLLNRVKISLVFFSRMNNDRYTRRVFELPATKTVMLSEYTSEMDSFWPEDEFCVYFRSKKDLVLKAERLLENPIQTSQLADKAFCRLKELRCSDTDRVREVLEDYTKIVKGSCSI